MVSRATSWLCLHKRNKGVNADVQKPGPVGLAVRLSKRRIEFVS